MGEVMKGVLIPVFCLLAHGAGAQGVEPLFDTPPEVHYRGFHYLNCTNLGESYIKYQTGDAEKNAALRRYALAIAKLVQIPEERVREGDLYHGRPTLWVTWRPWHSPFDETPPGKKQDTAYRILCSKRGLLLQANNADGAIFGTKVLLRVIEGAHGPYVQRMVIDDWRDLVEDSGLRSLKRHPYEARKPARARTSKDEKPRGQDHRRDREVKKSGRAGRAQAAR